MLTVENCGHLWGEKQLLGDDGEGDMNKMMKGTPSHLLVAALDLCTAVNAEFRPFLSVPPPDQGHCSKGTWSSLAAGDKLNKFDCTV